MLFLLNIVRYMIWQMISQTVKVHHKRIVCPYWVHPVLSKRNWVMVKTVFSENGPGVPRELLGINGLTDVSFIM